MRANPTERVAVELEAFLNTSKSPQLRRYLDLCEQAAAALNASLDTPQVRDGFSPAALFRGIEKGLAELCAGLPE